MLELTDALTTEEAEAATAYRILAAALEVLVSADATLAGRQGFELAMLRAAGFGLEFALCRACGALNSPTDGAYFIPSRGGIVCPRCRPMATESAVRLTPAVLVAMTRLNKAPLTDHPGLEHGGADGAQALARFLASILDRRLRSAVFLDTLL